MKVDISIVSSIKNFIEVFNIMISPKLTEKEIEVLAKILSYNIDYRKLEIDKRLKFIHSSGIRGEIRENLGLSSANYSNILKSMSNKSLSKIPILTKDSLHPNLDIPRVPESITFTLKNEGQNRSDDRGDSEEVPFEPVTSTGDVESIREILNRESNEGDRSDSYNELGKVHKQESVDGEYTQDAEVQERADDPAQGNESSRNHNLSSDLPIFGDDHVSGRHGGRGKTGQPAQPRNDNVW